MFGSLQNPVQIAVDRVGGPTKAANLTSVSNATVHNWVKAERIPKIDKAQILAKESGIELCYLRSTR